MAEHSVMAEFPWAPQTESAGDPPSPYIEVELTIEGVTRSVRGVLDTGADSTELIPPEVVNFKIDSKTVGYILDGRTKQPEPFVMAVGRIDGMEFQIPIAFVPAGIRSVNVFGRAGIVDHFKVELDPAAQVTRLTWSGRSPGSVIDALKKHIDETTAEMKARSPKPVLPFKPHGPGRKLKHRQ
jgi:hypothetical protein